MKSLGRASIAVVFGAITALASPTSAIACSLTHFANNGRYVGGSLVDQIVQEADTIQIVEVIRRDIVTRQYTAGERFLSFGERDVPEGWPEYIDTYAYELAVVETLKGGVPSNPDFYEDVLRVRGFGMEELNASLGDLASAEHPNGLPAWLLERPANDGFLFQPADEWAGLGGGGCSSPYLLDVGQRLVAFRDSMGRLYAPDNAFPLQVNVSIRTGNGRDESFAIALQSLVPISGPNDPFLTGLRSALPSD